MRGGGALALRAAVPLSERTYLRLDAAAVGYLLDDVEQTVRARQLKPGEYYWGVFVKRRSGLKPIFRRARKGQNQYMAAQFVVGIWEYHVNSLDEDLIRDVNEYMPTLMKKSWLNISCWLTSVETILVGYVKPAP